MSSLNILLGLRPNHLVVGLSETEACYETYDAARAFFARPLHIHLVLPLLAKEGAEFTEGLERELYPYGTKQNNGFHSRALIWESITWGILSIPRQDEATVRGYCKRHHRYLDQGIYTIHAQKRIEQFPFRGDNFRSVRMVHGLIAACV